jgi:integrase
MSEYDPGAADVRPWNAGRKVGAKRAFKPKQVWAVRFFLDHRRRLRDRALFDLAVDSKLRGCDVVSVKIGDLVLGGQVRSRGGTLDDYVFPSRVDHGAHLSTRQYARLVDEWVTGIGLRREEYGTHSLRRTKASIIYKATGNLRAVQILLGHTKIENTVRYLGVDVEDALALAEGTEI